MSGPDDSFGGEFVAGLGFGPVEPELEEDAIQARFDAWLASLPPPEPMPALDEARSRRPGWDDLEWIVLGDEQRWAIPRVDLRTLVGRPALRDLVADLMACPPIPDPGPDGENHEESWSVTERWSATILAITAELIVLNYAISGDDARALVGGPYRARGAPGRAFIYADQVDACLACMGHEAVMLAKSRGIPISPN